jgi:hypothetical protein
LATVLILFNIWFIPNFSSCVLAILPILTEEQRVFIYATHSAVISAFVINYANSVSTLQELEHGRYAHSDEWGQLIRDAKPVVQLLDSGARVAIGACFVWLEANLWRTGKIDVNGFGTQLRRLGGDVNVLEYREMLADVADSAFAAYFSIIAWILVTVGILLFTDSPHFRNRQAKTAIIRQVAIILCGFLVSIYTLYIARGRLALYEGSSHSQPVDSFVLIACSLVAAVVGLSLIALIGFRVWCKAGRGNMFAQEVD